MTKEEEILAAAEDEFFRNGYDATSTATIAGRAGVTHAMANYYFRTKEQLFFKIIDTHIQGFLGSLKKVMLAEGDFIQVLKGAATALFDKSVKTGSSLYHLGHFENPSGISGTHRETVVTLCREYQTPCAAACGTDSGWEGGKLYDGKHF